MSHVLRTVHRTSAVLVGVFAVVHMVHHLMALSSIEAHLVAARLLRTVYRNAWIEPALLLGVAAQWSTGLLLAIQRWRRPVARSTRLQKAQILSGLVLSLFLPIHVISVLQGRAAGLDTNFYFAAAGLHAPESAPWFVTYYGLAVMALILHLFIAVTPRSRAVALWPAAALAGAACGAALVLVLAGRVHPFDLPADYRLNDTSPTP
jgi:hypothetical protein